MKFHNLYINTDGTFETYQKITTLLNVNPKPEGQEFDLWTYQVITDEEHDNYFDFINHFLDMIEPNFEKLEILGVKREDITIWLFYEYTEQCAMEFNAQEMKRLGESGIPLNIDCIRKIEA